MISLNDYLSFSHVKIKALSLPSSCKRSLFLLKRLASSISWIEAEWGSTGSTLTELTASDKAWFSNHWYSPGPFGTLQKEINKIQEMAFPFLQSEPTLVHYGRFFSSSGDVRLNVALLTTHHLCLALVWPRGWLAIAWNYYLSIRRQFRLTPHLASCKPSVARVSYRLPAWAHLLVNALWKTKLPCSR